jgi:hypothetical protein
MKGAAHQPYQAEYLCNVHAGSSSQLDRDEEAGVEIPAQLSHGRGIGFSRRLREIGGPKSAQGAMTKRGQEVTAASLTDVAPDDRLCRRIRTPKVPSACASAVDHLGLPTITRGVPRGPTDGLQARRPRGRACRRRRLRDGLLYRGVGRIGLTSWPPSDRRRAAAAGPGRGAAPWAGPRGRPGAVRRGAARFSWAVDVA